MKGLTTGERERLEATIRARLGRRSDAAELMDAYLYGMERHAYHRTMARGPVPTSLVSERAEILMEISTQLGRIVEDFEIEALFRVTPTQAKSMRKTLLATHSDLANELYLQWSLVGARTAERRERGTISGSSIVFTAADRRDAFTAWADRVGYRVEVVHHDPERPWQVVVADDFPEPLLPGRS